MKVVCEPRMEEAPKAPCFGTMPARTKPSSKSIAFGRSRMDIHLSFGIVLDCNSPNSATKRNYNNWNSMIRTLIGLKCINIGNQIQNLQIGDNGRMYQIGHTLSPHKQAQIHIFSVGATLLLENSPSRKIMRLLQILSPFWKTSSRKSMDSKTLAQDFNVPLASHQK